MECPFDGIAEGFEGGERLRLGSAGHSGGNASRIDKCLAHRKGAAVNTRPRRKVRVTASGPMLSLRKRVTLNPPMRPVLIGRKPFIPPNKSLYFDTTGYIVW